MPLSPIASSIRVFSNESALHIRWPKYWSLSFSISTSNEYSTLIPLGLTDLISLQSKGLSRVFSSTSVWKNQLFNIQPSLWSTSYIHASVSSVAQSCLTLCDPMNCSMPGLPVHHQLPEFTQTHVYRVSDAIQPSHPLSSSSLPAPNPSQHQSLFQWVNSSHEVAKVLEFQL